MPATIELIRAAPKGAVIGVEFPRGYMADEQGLSFHPRSLRTLTSVWRKRLTLRRRWILMWYIAKV